jgi:mannose-1-phosphate guanylyltransferase
MPVSEQQVSSSAKPSFSEAEQPWAVLLAGGEGTRLQSLTLKIAGDSRPKQFCRIFGEASLLRQTQMRLDPLFRRDRNLYIVTRAHEPFYREELRNAGDSNIIAQPRNRGTGVAIAVALLHVLRRNSDAVVAFFPCDHYYADHQAFGLAVRSATAYARQYPASIILLGAEARYPEVEYGWIEPGETILNGPDVPLLRVNRFWEKPSLPQARALMRQGCLWNTFVTIGRAETVLQLLLAQIPDVVTCVAKAFVRNRLDLAYRGVRAVDFSRGVLALHPQRLLVVRDTASGWADLGSPARVIDTLARNGIKPTWMGEMGSADQMKGPGTYA